MARKTNTKKNISLLSKTECEEHGCTDKAESQCKYCKRHFCPKHTEPLLTGVGTPMRWAHAEGIHTYERQNNFSVKFKKYEQAKKFESTERDLGHPCFAYTDEQIKEDKRKQKELDEAIYNARNQIRPDKENIIYSSTPDDGFLPIKNPNFDNKKSINENSLYDIPTYKLTYKRGVILRWLSIGGISGVFFGYLMYLLGIFQPGEPIFDIGFWVVAGVIIGIVIGLLKVDNL